jgi:hypothetical protein
MSFLLKSVGLNFQGDFKAALQQWRDDYGDIVGLKLGNELAVILSDYEVVST